MGRWLLNKHILPVFLLLVCFTAPLKAAEYTVKTVPNVHLSDRTNYVSNPDGILTAEGVLQMNELLQTIKDSLGIEVAVVAIESVGNEDARQFATALFNEWGLGRKGEDNGLLIQLVTEPSQRSVVFETGYGLEGILPDAITYRIQQRYMLPDMKNGDYTAGMIKGVGAVKEYLLASDYKRQEMLGDEPAGGEPGVIGYFVLFVAFIFATVFLPIFITKFPKKCPVCGKRSLVRKKRRVLKAATRVSQGLAEDVYVCKNCGHTENRKHHLPRIQQGNGGGPIIGGGSFGGGSWGGGGGSWGGGRSGGGGSISRF